MLYDLNAQKDAPRTSGSKSPSPDSSTPEALKTPSKSSPSPRYTVPQFHHNPLHDLESIFWIAAYFLFKIDGRGAEAAAIARQQKATRELFYDKLQRSSCIHDSTHFIRLVRNLHPSVQPAGFCLDAWRSELVSTFHFAEKDCSRIACTVADSLHESLPRTLHRMTESVHPQNRKRPLQDDYDSHEERDGPSRSNKKPRVQVDSQLVSRDSFVTKQESVSPSESVPGARCRAPEEKAESEQPAYLRQSASISQPSRTSTLIVEANFGLDVDSIVQRISTGGAECTVLNT